MNSNGYIRLWEPFYQTGLIFGCNGNADGQNVAFRFANINATALQKALIARQEFELDRDCDLQNQPPDTLWVRFDYDGGFALNIVSA